MNDPSLYSTGHSDSESAQLFLKGRLLEFIFAVYFEFSLLKFWFSISVTRSCRIRTVYVCHKKKKWTYLAFTVSSSFVLFLCSVSYYSSRPLRSDPTGVFFCSIRHFGLYAILTSCLDFFITLASELYPFIYMFVCFCVCLKSILYLLGSVKPGIRLSKLEVSFRYL